MENKKLLTVKEFAKEYGLGVNKSYEVVYSKGFPMIKVGRKIYVLKDKVDEFFINSIGTSF